MTNRSSNGNTLLQKVQPRAMQMAGILSDLYWYVHVVEAGSFSAAAERYGLAKSSLSRRIAQLEQQLGVQLLNRSTRLFSMSTVGEQIYRYALEMLSAAEMAVICAQEANDSPGGLLRLSTPSVLSDWTLELLADFQRKHPSVQFALSLQDGHADIAAQRLDLCLSLNDVPRDSSTIVARELASLDMVLVASPALLEELGRPASLAMVPDNRLLALGSHAGAQAWRLGDGLREIGSPALCADNTQTLLQAARAGLGLACLPLCACHEEILSGSLQFACPDEILPPVTLYALTPPYKGITTTTRQLIAHVRETLANAPHDGVTLQP